MYSALLITLFVLFTPPETPLSLTGGVESAPVLRGIYEVLT
jgi:hypothetical protein